MLENDFQVKVIVRGIDKLQGISHNKNLEIIIENILDIDDKRMTEILLDVNAVISCLGHNITLKGIFGKPYYLVTESVKKVVNNLNVSKMKKFILMSTTACLNGNALEKYSFGEKIIITILSILLPPQRDNEQALKYLENVDLLENSFQWIAVRPDTLTERKRNN